MLMSKYQASISHDYKWPMCLQQSIVIVIVILAIYLGLAAKSLKELHQTRSFITTS